MPTPITSRTIARTLEAMAPFMAFMNDSSWARREVTPDTCDFVFGNPHDLPPAGFVPALERQLTPRTPDWYAYKLSEEEPRQVVARSLTDSRGVAFDPDDVYMTNGAFAAISVALGALLDPGDEVVFMTPPWFFYEAMIVARGGVPVKVPIDPHTFDLDLDAIAAALSERTRAVLVNSPHNPTGRIYPAPMLDDLGRILGEASARFGRPIVLLSDEAYVRIVYDGRDCPSPAAHYPHTLLLYTYGKTLLTPGQRIGYIAVPTAMPERRTLRDALTASQLVTGFAFPNALLQHALRDLDTLSTDIAALQRRRDRLVAELRAMGYRTHLPEGTFYLMVDAPEDDLAFTGRLAQHDVYVLPGSVVELPGTFRVSLTASDEMIERSLPHFAAAIAAVGGQVRSV